jgi:Domain of unknown function (DUF5122) beta-propeller
MHRPPNSPLRRMTRCASVVALSLVLGIGTASALPGDLDPTFGNGGIVTTPFGSFQDAKAVVIQPDGKIVAARGQDGNASSDFCLARYNADGSLDSSFDGDGHDRFRRQHGQRGGAPAAARWQARGGGDRRRSRRPPAPHRHLATTRTAPLDATFGSGG